MHTPSCPSQLPPQHPLYTRNSHRTAPRGQVLVIFAVALVALLFFVGLAVDAGVMYVAYGQLKRAIDSAAVASANNFKRGKTEGEMKEAAKETLRLHNIDISELATQLNVQICDDNKDGYRDVSLQTDAPEFYAMCPVTDPNPAPGTTAASPRKLVYVEARHFVNFYFLSLLGVNGINLRTSSVAEAAPIDLVVVIDTSGSMASECQTFDPSTGDCLFFKSHGYTSTSIDDYDPDASGNCNTDNSCHPLLEAKEAAKALVGTLYQGYDNVGVVTFNTVAVPITGNVGLVNTIDIADINNSIDSIKLHADAPYGKLWPKWRVPGRFNPFNPDDRDGDGTDTDSAAKLGYTCTLTPDRWDDSITKFGWGGAPCDDDGKLDSFNMVDDNTDGDGDPNTNPVYTQADTDAINNWLGNPAHDPDGAGPLSPSLSLASTCTGCGMRVASNLLKSYGRPGAVWVMVFLSDGFANASDTAATSGGFVPASYTNGFCAGKITNVAADARFWPSFCVDRDISTRYCLDTASGTCPPSTSWVTNPSPLYSVEDYARDMADSAAMTVNHSTDPLDTKYNPNEPIGNDIAIYTIGLGAVTPDQSYLTTHPGYGTGEKLLRYMAAVGDDGDRVTDPCKIAGVDITARTSCGNYYFAPSGDQLLPIFEDIASRIYTRISN